MELPRFLQQGPQRRRIHARHAALGEGELFCAECRGMGSSLRGRALGGLLVFQPEGNHHPVDGKILTAKAPQSLVRRTRKCRATLYGLIKWLICQYLRVCCAQFSNLYSARFTVKCLNRHVWASPAIGSMLTNLMAKICMYMSHVKYTKFKVRGNIRLFLRFLKDCRPTLHSCHSVNEPMPTRRIFEYPEKVFLYVHHYQQR